MKTVHEVSQFLITSANGLSNSTLTKHDRLIGSLQNSKAQFEHNDLSQSCSLLNSAKNDIYDLIFDERFMLWHITFAQYLSSISSDASFTEADLKKFFDSANTRNDLWSHPQMIELIAFIQK